MIGIHSASALKRIVTLVTGILFGVPCVAAATTSPGFPASATSCQTFIGDGRGLLVRVRELATYPVIASAVATGANATPIHADDLSFKWLPFDGDWDSSLDHEIDAWLPGHAYLHTGSHERTITIHVTAYWRRGNIVTPCVPAEQSYEVGPDYEAFASVDYARGSVSNELSPGNPTTGLTRAVQVSDEMSLFSLPLMVGAEWRDYHYDHTSNIAIAAQSYCQSVRGDPGCVTIVGHAAYERLLGFGQTFIPSRVSVDQDVDVRVGIKVLDPHIYLGFSYAYRRLDDVGSPFYGFGYGIEKQPSLDHAISFEASGWQYSDMRANYHGPTGPEYGVLSGSAFTPQYKVLTYRVGLTFTTRIGRYFWEAGEVGDKGYPNEQAASPFTHHGFFAGGGWRL